MGGISSVIGALALIGFLAFLAGVGIVVVSASQGRPVRNGIMLSVAGLIAGLLLTVVSQGIIVVEPQQAAVVFQTLSGRLEDPRGPGTHIIIPVLQDATIYPVRQQEYTMADESEQIGQRGNDAIVARTRDGQEVRIDVTVLFNINATQVNTVHERWQTTYLDQFVRPTVRNLVRNEVALYPAEAIYGVSRAELESRAEANIRLAFEREGLNLTGFLVRSLNFSPDFAESIERKEIEAQELQRAVTEAQRVQTEAGGRAEAAIEEARGDAQATILRAQAQAEALSLISAQIAANPALIQYEYIQQLADNVTLALIPSNSPFLFDFDSIQNLPDAQADFQAPAIPETIPLPTPQPGGNGGGGN
jgi:regulator of protease activity HflC (stomatin/prohibitin superfamily)